MPIKHEPDLAESFSASFGCALCNIHCKLNSICWIKENLNGYFQWLCPL